MNISKKHKKNSLCSPLHKKLRNSKKYKRGLLTMPSGLINKEEVLHQSLLSCWHFTVKGFVRRSPLILFKNFIEDLIERIVKNFHNFLKYSHHEFLCFFKLAKSLLRGGISLPFLFSLLTLAGRKWCREFG